MGAKPRNPIRIYRDTARVARPTVQEVCNACSTVTSESKRDNVRAMRRFAAQCGASLRLPIEHAKRTQLPKRQLKDRHSPIA
jgi:hypothetical protein